MRFMDKIKNAWLYNDSLLCVGLDPDMTRLPSCLRTNDPEQDIFEFNKAIIDSTHDLVCAYKPQIAYFSAESAERALTRTVSYIKSEYPHIPVILDSKRGDIGSTAEKYAAESFIRYDADAVTVNPYLGFDSIEPFIEFKDRGVILLCRTSNKGAGDFQDLIVDGMPLYLQVAKTIRDNWNSHGNCLLVVGATWPEQMLAIRELMGDMPFLVPGVGAQGGNVEEIVKSGQTRNGTGLIISSSRAILYADDGDNFAEAARGVSKSLRDSINKHRTKNANRQS